MMLGRLLNCFYKNSVKYIKKNTKKFGYIIKRIYIFVV